MQKMRYPVPPVEREGNHMFCKGCGKAIEATASVCPYCKRPVEKLEGGIGFFDLAGRASKENQSDVITNRSVNQDIIAKLKRTDRSIRLMKWVLLIALMLSSISLCLGFISYTQLKAIKQEQDKTSHIIASVEQAFQDLKDYSANSINGFSSKINKIEQSQEEMGDQINGINEQVEDIVQEDIEPGITDRSDSFVEGKENDDITLFVKAKGNKLVFQWQKQNSFGTWVNITPQRESKQFSVEIEEDSSFLSFAITAQTTGKYRCILYDNGREFDSAEFEIATQEQTIPTEKTQDNMNNENTGFFPWANHA